MNAIKGNKKLRDDQELNRANRFITLEDRCIEKNNALLREVIDAIIAIMKKSDQLFADMYEKMIFAGSYYKGTKVGKPGEFDLDLILRLPVDYSKIQFEEVRPGYAKIKLPAELKPEWNHKPLAKFLASNNYLSNEQLRRWFEGVVTKAFGTLQRASDGWYIIPGNSADEFKVKTRKSGPAFTLFVLHPTKDAKFDVDIVPVLKFNTWPKLKPFEILGAVKRDWYLVPKPLTTGPTPELSWRFCFYEHEKHLLRRNGKIKNVIRHLKKLRDCQNWSPLASYYIETLIYNELGAGGALENHWGSSMMELLLLMLTHLKAACVKMSIPYHWDSRHNLLAEKKPEQLQSPAYRIDKIIKDVSSEPKQILNYLLNPEEREALEQMEASNVEEPPSPAVPDSGASSPTTEDSPSPEDTPTVRARLLTNFPLSESAHDVQSMDQIAILTRTVAILSDEVKILKTVITDEMEELRGTVRILAEQTSTMSKIIELLLRQKIKGEVS